MSSEKRAIAQAYVVDWLGLPPELVDDMFSMSSSDPELSAYYGYPEVQAHILFERHLGKASLNGVYLDEMATSLV